MIVIDARKFIKASFNSERELEDVVIKNYENFFGYNSIFLPKSKISTKDGAGTIPDGFAIGLESKQWYLVEAELIHHPVWQHIVQQISKQLLASQQPGTRRLLEELAIKKYEEEEETKEKFLDLNIEALHVRKVLIEILEKDPIIGIPIDGLTDDLTAWAKSLRYKVKLWMVEKYIEVDNPTQVIYSFPEEARPTLDTQREDVIVGGVDAITKDDIGMVDLLEAGILTQNQELIFTYRPRNAQAREFRAKVLDDGALEVLGQVIRSPSYAAVACIRNAGSTRQTINGWTHWKISPTGPTIGDLREKYVQQKNLQLLKENQSVDQIAEIQPSVLN